MQISTVQTEEVVVPERDVKASIEDGAMVVICGDQIFLDMVGFDDSSCRSEVSRYSAPCWKMLDQVVSDWVFVGNDEGYKKYSSASDLFTRCVQAELFVSEMNVRALQEKSRKTE